MYASETQGQRLTFGVSGKLIMNALVMYDHQTESLWSHFTGDAVEGPMKGVSLELVPALHTNWGQWLELHPDTLALDKKGGSSLDPYADYYQRGDAGVLGNVRRDDRLDGKDLVTAVSVGDQHRAYSNWSLRETPVVNDTLGDLPLLVVYHAGSGTSAVFEREVDGLTLEFQAAPTEEGAVPLVIDQEGVTWHGLTGEALDGPNAGQRLTRVRAHYSFWFAWKDWRPTTTIYGQ